MSAAGEKGNENCMPISRPSGGPFLFCPECCLHRRQTTMCENQKQSESSPNPISLTRSQLFLFAARRQRWIDIQAFTSASKPAYIGVGLAGSMGTHSRKTVSTADYRGQSAKIRNSVVRVTATENKIYCNAANKNIWFMRTSEFPNKGESTIISFLRGSDSLTSFHESFG